MSWAKKSEGDEKFDLEATVARGLPYKRGRSNLTVGELRKIIANSTKEKVYSKADALQAVNKLSGTWGLTVKARDVAKRRKMTTEERKNTQPDIDRTDVVFAEKSEKNYKLDENLGEQLHDWLDNAGKKGGKYNGVYFLFNSHFIHLR